MKVLYLTSESLCIDPIISSQVIPLLSAIKSESNPTLLTFEPKRFNLGPQSEKLGIELRSLIRGKHFINQIALLHWLIKNGSQFDVIHVRSYLPMVMAVIYKLFNNKVSLVFDPRGLFAEELEYCKGKNIFSFIFRKLEAYFVRHSDAVIAVSESMMDYFRINYMDSASKVKHIPTFAQVPLKTNSIQVPDIRKNAGWDNEVLLCYSGSLEVWQCFDEILNVFSILQNRSPKFRFVFFSKDSQEVHSRIQGFLSLGSYSIYSATPEQLPSYLSQCDYGFLVRRPHIINRVAAPIKVKDYLLAGLHLVVTSGVGDTSEFLSKNNCGITVQYEDILNGVIDHTQLELQVSSNEKQRISNLAAAEFSLEVAAKRHLSLYSSL